MNLSKRDLHFIYSRSTNRLKAFDYRGGQLLDVECRNRTVNDGTLARWGNCPPGTFVLEPPVPKNTVPFGAWFIGLADWAECHEMSVHGRSGIGIHGGGTGLSNPFAPQQSPPWVPTHGCLRVCNQDLAAIVHWVRWSQQQGGTAYITVEAPAPAAAIDGEDDYLDVSEDQLFPDE